MPEVTAVITCMTDSERPFVREAVESVLAQSVATDVVLCMADDNPWVHTDLGDLLPRVRLLQLPLQPSGLVRNAGVEEARTELVAFLDGDDAWRPDKVERQVALLRKHRLDLIGSKHLLIREDGKAFFYGFAQGLPMTSSWLGHRRIFVERPFSDQQVAQDVELWHRLTPDLRLGVADAFLLRYRIRAGSASKATASMRRKAAYERRSHRLGGRPALLAGSRLANLALTTRHRLRRGGQTSGLLHVR